MRKNYLIICLIFVQTLLFAQTNFIEQYNFTDGSLIGDNGNANYDGLAYTFIEDNGGSPNRAINVSGSGPVNVGSVTSDPSTGFTISFWLKPDADISNQFSVLSTRQVCNWGNFMDVLGNPTLGVISGGFRTLNQKSCFARVDYTPGEWAKLTYVYDNDAAHVFAYKNGVKVDFSGYQDGQAPIALTSGPIGIASSQCVNQDGTVRYKGGIDQIEVFDKALTPVEVADMDNFADRPNALLGQFDLDFTPYTNLVNDPNDEIDAAISLDGSEAVKLGNPTLDPRVNGGLTEALWLKPSSANTG